MSRGHLRAAIAVALAAVTLVGCGNGSGRTARDAPASSAPGAATAAEVDVRTALAASAGVHLGEALARTTPAGLGALWIDADTDGALTGLLRDGPITAAGLQLGAPPEVDRASSHRAFAATAPREIGVDEPDIETSTTTKEVETANGQTLRSTVTSEMRLEQRRITMTTTQSIAAVAQPSAGEMGQELGGEIGACPTIDGTVVGTVSYRVRLGAEDGTSIVDVRLRADLQATVDAHREPVSFDLTNVDGGVETTDKDGEPIAVRATGSVVGAPGDLLEFGGGTMAVSIDGDGELLDENTSRMIGAVVAQLQLAARTMLSAISGATDNGLCVKVVVDRHGVQVLGPGETTTIDATVIDSSTGAEIDAPADAFPETGSVDPRGVTTSPVTFRYVAGAERRVNSVIVGTDSVLGAHSITLTYEQRPGWKVDAKVSVFRMVGTKCDGIAGTWRFVLSAAFAGATFSGEVIAEVGADGTGSFELSGHTTGGGVTVAQGGRGTMTITEHDDGSASMSILGEAHVIVGSHVGEGGPFGDGAPIALVRAAGDDCPAPN